MIDCEHCLICGTYIGRGNDPAICGKKSCMDIFYYEIGFEKWCKEQVQKEDKEVLKWKNN